MHKGVLFQDNSYKALCYENIPAVSCYKGDQALHKCSLGDSVSRKVFSQLSVLLFSCLIRKNLDDLKSYTLQIKVLTAAITFLFFSVALHPTALQPAKPASLPLP